MTTIHPSHLRASRRTPLPVHRARPTVFLFTGHIVDAPDRAVPRFPASAVPAAALRIAHALHEADARPGDLALTQGAAGGDLLFCHAALQLHLSLALLQPFDETTFVHASVAHRGPDWVARYEAVRRQIPGQAVQSAPLVLGALKPGQDAYARCNEWLLATARQAAATPASLHVLALWDGEGGDGPGGTAHLVDTARATGARVTVIHPMRPRAQRQVA